MNKIKKILIEYNTIQLIIFFFFLNRLFFYYYEFIYNKIIKILLGNFK